MEKIVIAGGLRTPQGRLGGSLKGFTNQKLGACLLKALFERSNLDKNAIDEVIFGCVGQYSDAVNVARVISLMAELNPEIPAFTVSRNCASGLQAVVSAAQMLLLKEADLIIAGGVEVMSAAPYINRDLRFGKRIRNSQMIDSLWEGLTDPVCNMIMGQTAEILAEDFGITRHEQDAFALLSHKKACDAQKIGKFKEEIFGVEVNKKGFDRKLETKIFEEDDGPNNLVTETILAGLSPAFKEDGTVTAGNSCFVSDGAAALIVTTESKAKRLGLEIMGYVKFWGFTGVDPKRMGMGPVKAIKKTLKKAKLTLKDIELIEINESFSAQYLAVERELELDRSIVNVNGGGIALGHPVGTSGARVLVTLLHEMKRRNLSLGLVGMCVGGGQGGSMIIERR